MSLLKEEQSPLFKTANPAYVTYKIDEAEDG